jgi:tetratricopeptide (TPR) repeat protein
MKKILFVFSSSLRFVQSLKAWQRSQQELAYNFASEAIDHIHEPTQTLYLAIVTYNFGGEHIHIFSHSSSSKTFRSMIDFCVMYKRLVQLHSEKHYKEAIKWLELSVDIYNKDSQHDKVRQAKTLRLLGTCEKPLFFCTILRSDTGLFSKANCYIEQSNHEKALRCIELANIEDPQPVGFYLLVKVSFLSKKSNAPEILYNFLNLKNCSFDM